MTRRYRFGRFFSARVPFVAQMEFAECGAACLCSVLRGFGRHASLIECRAATGTSRDGTTAWDLAEAARGYGLEVQALRATYAGLRQRVAAPAILHWQGNHFVVLERLTRQGAIIMDPASGKRRASHAEIIRSFSGIALVVARGSSFAKVAAPWLLRQRLPELWRKAGARLLFIVVSLFFLELLGLLFPSLTQVMIDGVLVPRQRDWVWVLAVAGALAATLETALRLLRDEAGRELGAVLDITLKHRFVEHLLALPNAFFRQRAAGDLVQRAAGTASIGAFATSLVQLSLDALLVLGFGALMLAYHPRLALLTICLNLLQIAAMVALTRPTGQLIAAELAYTGKEGATLTEALHQPEQVRAFEAEAFFREGYHDRLVARLSRGAAWRRFAHAAGSVGVVLEAVTLTAVLGYGGLQVAAGALTPGALAAFIALQVMLVRPLSAAAGVASEFLSLRGALERIEDIEGAPRERAGGVALAALRGHVRVRDVSFAHRRGADPLFQGLDFEVQPGEHLAIVGPSGAGKSTVLQLLLGACAPTRGSVEIDGQDLRALALESFRRRVGVVLQESFFINDTVRANLCLDGADVATEQLVAAARTAGIDAVIRGLPEGYDTPLGEGARRLSGGERQRLALARALVKQPRLLILDEATSALDAETEDLVQRNLDALGITRITIAHRLTTVKNADQIVVLARGAVQQRGRFHDLLEARGLFREMMAEGA